MTDNKKNQGTGSENADFETQEDTKTKGGQASQDSQDYGQNENQDSDSRGFEKMKEEGRDEEVSEIASLGGQSSHGGGRNQGEE